MFFFRKWYVFGFFFFALCRDPDFKVLLTILISTPGRHFNLRYRSRRVMLMSSWLVKNILLLENILASALGANWALWQCSAWLVHINTKRWKIQFCSSFRELCKDKEQKKPQKNPQNIDLRLVLTLRLAWWVSKCVLRCRTKARN